MNPSTKPFPAILNVIVYCALKPTVVYYFAEITPVPVANSVLSAKKGDVVRIFAGTPSRDVMIYIPPVMSYTLTDSVGVVTPRLVKIKLLHLTVTGLSVSEGTSASLMSQYVLGTPVELAVHFLVQNTCWNSAR